MSDQENPHLVPLPGFPFPVLASPGVEDRGRLIAGRCADAYRFLGSVLEFEPDVTLLALAERDWPEDHQPFGNPFYDNGRLVVAAEDAHFWRLFEEPLRRTRPDLLAAVIAVYGEGLDLGPFFDLLAVHELGHGFHAGRHTRFPRHWLEELFANLCLHCFVAKAEPHALPVLETFPNALVAVDASQFEHRSLEAFEELYSNMDGVNYGWFQCHLHVAARRSFESGATAALQRLWSRFVFSDTKLADLLEREVDSEVARVLTAWPGTTV